MVGPIVRSQYSGLRLNSSFCDVCAVGIRTLISWPGQSQHHSVAHSTAVVPYGLLYVHPHPENGDRIGVGLLFEEPGRRPSVLHACCRRRQAWNRLGDNRRNRRSARNGTNSRARSTARRILILACPSGRRSSVNVNPELRSRARASRRRAASFFRRRRSSRTSWWSSDALRSVTSRLTTIVGVLPSHPRAVERGTPSIRGDGHIPRVLDEIPKPVVVALLRAGRGGHGNDHRPFPHAAQLIEDEWERPRSDDNSRGKVRMSVGTARLRM